MGYFYKLVDKGRMEDAKKGIISLSRPLFEFKGSEGKIIEFAKSINERFKKDGRQIEPTKKDNTVITKWIKAYRESYGKINNDDLNTDSKIMFCRIMSEYCGYFTSADLDNPNVLKEFLRNNKLHDKIGYIRIDERVYGHSHWRSIKDDFVFEKCDDTDESLIHLNGFLHSKDVVYSKDYEDYKGILKEYNKDEVRTGFCWFTLQSDKFSYQKENRFVFSLQSLNKNSSTIGCESVYQSKDHNKNTIEIRIFENIVNALIYSEHGPKFVKLKFNPQDVLIKEFL